MNKVKNMVDMVSECYRLEYLDMSNFDLSSLVVPNKKSGVGIQIINKCDNLREVVSNNKFLRRKCNILNKVLSRIK